MDNREILKRVQMFSEIYEVERPILKTMPLFSEFYEAETDALIRAAVPRSVPRGHVFLNTGDVNAAIFIICVGSVKVEQSGGGDEIAIATLGAGESFGKLSFMDASPAKTSVTAAEATRVIELSREAVDQVIAGHAPLALKLWRNLAGVLKQRLAQTNDAIGQYLGGTPLPPKSQPVPA